MSSNPTPPIADDSSGSDPESQEASRIRKAILEGHQDVVAGRTVAYRGDLRGLLKLAPSQGELS